MNWHRKHMETRSLGERVADRVASFVGSWTFIWIQTSLMAVWIAGNAYLYFHFDPFPFIFLNLFMSAEAAYSTPVIMMSQNRQAERDRHQAEEDYRVNLEAKRDIGEHFRLTREQSLKLDLILAALTPKAIPPRTKTVRTRKHGT
jgi:uncharacterized membrane protein